MSLECSPQSALRIIVCGDVDGQFEKLFKRISVVNKKHGPFEMLLCVGSFFGNYNSDWEKILSGKLKAPLSTYILGPCRPEHVKFFPDPNGGDLAPNVTFLGKKGILRGSSGLTIAYLSGIEGSSEGGHIFTTRDSIDLQTNFSNRFVGGVDILLTAQWPKAVTKYDVSPTGIDAMKCGSQLLSCVAKFLKPRYHFSGLENVFYERTPYRNHKIISELTRHVTRFISVAKVGNTEKQKWLYAITISPMCVMPTKELIEQPSMVTECPYTEDITTANEKMEGPASQFFYDFSKPEGRKRKFNHGENPKKHKQSKEQALESCWFCLRNEELEKHLVVSIGQTCYLALAKGGLTPDHVLILPNAHYQSVTDLPEEELKEIDQFKTALQDYFKSQDKCAVFFERNYKSRHLQIQVVPVPVKCKSHLKEIFMNHAASQCIDLDEIPVTTMLKQVISPSKPYFCAEIGSDEKLLCVIQNDFPLQFGREVLASPPILNMPHRADWKECNVTKEEETEMSRKFRRNFDPFDFTS